MEEIKDIVYITHDDDITAENVNCHYEDGLTPLTYVLEHRYDQLAERYLKLGADPYLKDLKGALPIEYVLYRSDQYPMYIRMLLKYGFDIRHPRSDGTTYLEYFLKRGYNEHLSIALDYCTQEEFDNFKDIITEKIVNDFISSRKIFGYYTDLEDAFLIEKLMSKGFDPVAGLKDGTNLLMIVSCRGIGYGTLYSIEAISKFLGPKLPDAINLQDKNGLTPLFYAAEFCRISETLYLIKSGASLTIKDKNGNTFLGYMINRLSKIVNKERPFHKITYKVHETTSENLVKKIFSYFEDILPEIRKMGYDLNELAGVDLKVFFDKLENRDFIRFYLQMTKHKPYLNFTNGLLLDKKAKFTGEWVVASKNALDTNMHLNAVSRATVFAFDGFYVLTNYLKGLQTDGTVIPLFSYLKDDFKKTNIVQLKSPGKKDEYKYHRQYGFRIINEEPLPDDKPLMETKFQLIDEEVTIYTIPDDEKNRGYILYKGQEIKVSTIDIYDYQSEAYDKLEIKVSVSSKNVSLEEFFVRAECVKVEKIKYEESTPLYIVKAEVIHGYDGIIYIDLLNLKALIIKVDYTYSVY